MPDFRVGEKVYYVRPDQRRCRAVIVSVHYDDVPVYYTLRLLRTQHEVQTVHDRLRHRSSHRSTCPGRSRLPPAPS